MYLSAFAVKIYVIFIRGFVLLYKIFKLIYIWIKRIIFIVQKIKGNNGREYTC